MRRKSSDDEAEEEKVRKNRKINMMKSSHSWRCGFRWEGWWVADKKEDKIKQKYIAQEEWNKTKPIWTRNSDDIIQEEYGEFYESFTNYWEDHSSKALLCRRSIGDSNFAVLIPVGLLLTSSRTKRKDHQTVYLPCVHHGQLWWELIPEYLNFIHGVVDSEDLHLNISREMLQQSSKFWRLFIRTLLRSALNSFLRLAEDKKEK